MYILFREICLSRHYGYKERQERRESAVLDFFTVSGSAHFSSLLHTYPLYTLPFDACVWIFHLVLAHTTHIL
jgi:hypothetical protein